jgi:hypothetical protein
MNSRKFVCLTVLGLLWLAFLAKQTRAQEKKDQAPSKTESAHKEDKQDADKDKEKEKAKDSSPAATGTSSHLQVVYPPTDIVAGEDCQSRISAFAVRATAKGLNLKGPVIVGGGLQDKDSPSSQMPAQAFQLLSKSGTDCGAYAEIKDGSLPKISDDLSESPIYIRLSDRWINAGSYTGTLWIAGKGDGESAAQAVALKVFVRPWYAWIWGVVAIVVGAFISWFSVIYVARQRQMAANQVLVARFVDLLNGLEGILKQVGAAGAPNPTRTLAHIQEIQNTRLRELLNDKELSVLAGVTVPPTGTISVVDEIEGLNRIVQNGFARLLDLWNAPAASHDQLAPLFTAMDALGASAQVLSALDQKIQNILSEAPGAVAHAFGQPLPDLPTEDVVIHRVVTTTYMLDVLSLLSVIVLGTYVLIWKNPGFGTAGNYVEAFLWGLGLKLTGDVTKLGPSDVRTAFGIKIPSASA